jgi:thymidylate synthase (FAD)
MATLENKNPWYIEGSSKARLVTCTPDAEAHMAYIARVTSKDQSNPNFERLLKYCVKHGHWSVMEQSTMTVEVVTPLAIAVQLLRHASFRFQQFSGRYEDQQEMLKHTADLSSFSNLFYMPEEAREQDPKNRQNSLPASDPGLTDAMWATMSTSYMVSLQCYNDLLTRGISKEIARFVLPQGVYSRLYVTGNCRSFLHYIGVRDDDGVAQYEHCELARCIKSVFSNTFPTVSKAVFDVAPTPLEKENEELKAELEVLKAIQRGKL